MTQGGMAICPVQRIVGRRMMTSQAWAGEGEDGREWRRGLGGLLADDRTNPAGGT